MVPRRAAQHTMCGKPPLMRVAPPSVNPAGLTLVDRREPAIIVTVFEHGGSPSSRNTRPGAAVIISPFAQLHTIKDRAIDYRIFERIDGITQLLLAGGDMTTEEGRWLIRLDHDYLPWLMAGADRQRKTFRGDEVEVCAISNVRSGNGAGGGAGGGRGGHRKTAAPKYNY